MAKERQVQRTKEKNPSYRGEGRDEGEGGEWRSWLNIQNIQETDHGIQSRHFMANRWGNNGNYDRLFPWAPKSLRTATAAMKLKDTCSLEEKLWQTCCCCWVAKSCPTLCNPIDSSPPGSPIPGILQARTLEWVAISSNAWKWKVKGKSLSHVRLLATPWTAAHQAPPSMGFSRQEYWCGVPLPSLAMIPRLY